MNKIESSIDNMLQEARAIYSDNPEMAIALCLQARSMASANGLLSYEGEALLQSIVVYRLMDRYEEALDSAADAREIFSKTDDADGFMRLNNLIGILYYYNGVYERAIYHLNESYTSAKKLDDKSLVVSTLNNIGEVHKKAGNLKDAMDIFLKAAEISQNEGLTFHYGVIVQNIGELHVLQGNLNKAEGHFHDAYASFLDRSEATSLSELYLNLGRLYMKRNEPERARSYCEHALNSLENVDNKFYLIDVLIELYKIDSIDDPDEAVKFLKKAERLAADSKINHKLSEIEHMLHEHYEKKGDYERALLYFKTHHNLLKQIEATNLILKLKIMRLEGLNALANEIPDSVNELMRDEINQERAKIEQLKIDNAELAYKAMRDKLTKLPNRRRIDMEFERLLEKALDIRKRTDVAIFMIDIDHFKMVNDNMGHIFGDQCLEAISGRLMSISAEVGRFTGRFGGEEFIFIVEGCDRGLAYQIGAQINREIREQGITYQVDGEDRVLTVSVGGLYCENLAGFEKLILLDMADRALYLAKASGRDRFILHDYKTRDVLESKTCLS